MDAIAASLLAVWLVYLAAAAFGRKIQVTQEMMVQNAVLFAALVVIILALLIVRDRNPIAIFGLRWDGWANGLAFTALGLVSLYPILLLIQVTVQKVMGPGAQAQEMVQFFAETTGSEDRIMVALLAVVCAPVAEEVIFRGYIHGVARQYLGVWPAVILNAGLFAFIHAHVPSFPGLFILAVALTLIYERTGSLWAPIVFHGAFNGITLAATLAFPSVAR